MIPDEWEVFVAGVVAGIVFMMALGFIAWLFDFGKRVGHKVDHFEDPISGPDVMTKEGEKLLNELLMIKAELWILEHGLMLKEIRYLESGREQ